MPATYYVNCVFAWVTVLLAIIGYFYTLRQTGERWAFWLIFATGWSMFAISHSMKIAGVAPAATSHTVKSNRILAGGNSSIKFNPQSETGIELREQKDLL